VSGLVAVAHLDGSSVPDAHLKAMVAAAKYRGRDGVRGWRGTQRTSTASDAGPANVALVYQAVHVTPESTLEKQPLVDDQHGLVLIADVRLDDRDALREELEPYLVPVRGGASDPRTRPTDADLVLAAYLRWGDAFGAHLIGDFAIVLLDRRIGTLFALRDPMGLRPLFHRVESRRVLVASEVAQILAVPGVERRVFEPAIVAHLLGNFDTGSWTAYEGIFLVPPGHLAAIRLQDGAAVPDVRRYWDVDPHARVREKDEEAYADRFRTVFAQAVAARLRSNRPVAIQLSGGMDSGAVAAMTGKLRQNGRVIAPGVRTYSWAFDELVEADEREVSDLIVRHYGLEAAPVAADELWPLRDYPAHAPDVDDPFAGVYQVLLDHAARQAAADGMGVLLTGNRGDLTVGDVVRDGPGALLAGQWEAVRNDLRTYQKWKKVGTAKAISGLLVRPALDSVAMHPLLAPLRNAWRTARPRTPKPLEAPAWLRPEVLDRTRDAIEALQPIEPPADLLGTARRMRYRFIFTQIQMRTLLWDERLSARAGLSLADPWSDRRITELVLAMPQWAVQRLSEPKRIARLAMRYVMPEEARQRVGKRSPAPLYRRALETRARSTIERLLTNSASEAWGFIDEKALLAHYHDVANGAAETPELWWALTLEMWLRTHHRPVEGAR
jgi:asparagine synthase (glutamine-hydrolysing)